MGIRNESYLSSESIVCTGRCCASYGEILQGVLPNDEHFLVTLPIATATVVKFFPSQSSEIAVFPESKTKTAAFVEKVKKHFSLDFTGTFSVESEIPEGKGLSGSTADMIAALRSLESHYGCAFEKSAVDSILQSIEPSDGVLYEGSVVYCHRKCRFVKTLGKLPKMTVLSVDFGGQIDTVSYNANKKIVPFALKEEYKKLLHELSVAFACQDLFRIGSVATRSALLNQSFNYKEGLDAMIDFAQTAQAFGVINTHSGTCLGLLTDTTGTVLNNLSEELQALFPGKTVTRYSTL